MTATGEVRPVALLENHTAVLGERSVTLRERRVERFANGTVRRNLTRTVYVAEDGSYYLEERYRGSVAWSLGTTAGRYQRWSNGSIGLEAVTVGDARRYGVEQPTLRAVTRFDRLYLLLSTLEPTVSCAGEGGVRLRADGATSVDRIARRGVTDPRNVTLRARIGPEGLVRAYRLTYTGTVDGTIVRMTERVAFADLGRTDVPQPAWVPEAFERLEGAADGSRE